MFYDHDIPTLTAKKSLSFFSPTQEMDWRQENKIKSAWKTRNR